jgi:hypothetical protein
MNALDSSLHSSIAGLLLVVLPLILASGCGENPDKNLSERDTSETEGSPDSLARALASRYLGYSYQGASLRSTHPLNDSLFALKPGASADGPVVLVDTFSFAPDAVTHQDSVQVVRIDVPHARQVSKTWRLLDLSATRSFTVRIRNGKVTQAPRLVGWSALQRHIQRVEPDSGDAIVERLRTEWANATGTRPAV